MLTAPCLCWSVSSVPAPASVPTIFNFFFFLVLFPDGHDPIRARDPRGPTGTTVVQYRTASSWVGARHMEKKKNARDPARRARERHPARGRGATLGVTVEYLGFIPSSVQGLHHHARARANVNGDNGLTPETAHGGTGAGSPSASDEPSHSRRARPRGDGAATSGTAALAPLAAGACTPGGPPHRAGAAAGPPGGDRGGGRGRASRACGDRGARRGRGH